MTCKNVRDFCKSSLEGTFQEFRRQSASNTSRNRDVSRPSFTKPEPIGETCPEREKSDLSDFCRSLVRLPFHQHRPYQPQFLPTPKILLLALLVLLLGLQWGCGPQTKKDDPGKVCETLPDETCCAPLPDEECEYGGYLKFLSPAMKKQRLDASVLSLCTIQELCGKRTVVNQYEDRQAWQKSLASYGYYDELLNSSTYGEPSSQKRELFTFDARYQYILAILGENLEEYARLPMEQRHKLGFLFLSHKGLVDIDEYLKALAPQKTSQALQTNEEILRGKLLFCADVLAYLGKAKLLNAQRRKALQDQVYDQPRSKQLVEALCNRSNFRMTYSPQETLELFQEKVTYLLQELQSGVIDPKIPMQWRDNDFWHLFLRTPFYPDYSLPSTLELFTVVLASIPDEKILPLEQRKQLALWLYQSGSENVLENLFTPSHQYYQYPNYFKMYGKELLQEGFENFLPQEMHFLDAESRTALLQAGYPASSRALYYAVTNDDLEMAAELLKANASVLPPHDNSTKFFLPHAGRESCLKVATRRGNREMETLLRSHMTSSDNSIFPESSLDQERLYGQFWNAFLAKDYETQKQLLESGAVHPNLPWYDHNREVSLLFCALEAKDLQATKLLLDAKANITYHNYLATAYTNNFLEGFQALLEHGILDNMKQQDLSFAFELLQKKTTSKPDQTEGLPFLETLLEYLPSEKLPLLEYKQTSSAPGLTLPQYVLGNLKSTSLSEKLEILKTLKKHDIPIAPPVDGMHQSLFLPLLQNLSAPNYISKQQITYWLPEDYVKLLDFLLNNGEDANRTALPKPKNSPGKEPLEMTSLLTYMARTNHGNAALVAYLLEHGAKTNIPDASGKTCMDYLAGQEKAPQWSPLFVPEKYAELRQKDYDENYRTAKTVEELFLLNPKGIFKNCFDNAGLSDNALGLTFSSAMDDFQANEIRLSPNDGKRKYFLQYNHCTDYMRKIVVKVQSLSAKEQFQSLSAIAEAQVQNNKLSLRNTMANNKSICNPVFNSVTPVAQMPALGVEYVTYTMAYQGFSPRIHERKLFHHGSSNLLFLRKGYLVSICYYVMDRSEPIDLEALCTTMVKIFAENTRNLDAPGKSSPPQDLN